MAGTKISALTAAAALGGTEAIPAVQSAATVKITAAQIKTFTSASPTLVTPVLGVATGTSLALGGATIGSNALAVTGTANVSGTITTGVDGDINAGGYVRVPSNLAFYWAGSTVLRAPASGAVSVIDTSETKSFTLSAPTATATPSMQLGAADAASPVAQTIKFQDVAAGTSNTAGVSATVQAPAGTGTGAGGSLIFQVAPAGSSGSAKNAWQTALTIDSTKVASFVGSINVAGGEGLTTTGRGGIIQAADGVFRVYNQANSSTFSITAGASNLATFNGGITAATFLKSGSYTVATVPSASSAGAGARIYVSDEVGGASPAFSDATNWRRYADRAIIA